jgi:hypothetical protein
MLLSEKIELIIYIFEQSKSDFEWYDKQVNLEENRKNNINHEIEGVGNPDSKPPSYSKRASLATELQKCLIARRIAKDVREINRPVFDYSNTDVGKTTLNFLKQCLGDVRKIEKNMKERRYFHRPTENSECLNESAKKNLDELIRDWKKSRKNK